MGFSNLVVDDNAAKVVVYDVFVRSTQRKSGEERWSRLQTAAAGTVLPDEIAARYLARSVGADEVWVFPVGGFDPTLVGIAGGR